MLALPAMLGQYDHDQPEDTQHCGACAANFDRTYIDTAVDTCPRNSNLSACFIHKSRKRNLNEA